MVKPEFIKILENDPRHHHVRNQTRSLLHRVYGEFYVCIFLIILGFITGLKLFYVLAFILHLLFIFLMWGSVNKEKYNPLLIDAEVTAYGFLGQDVYNKDLHSIDELRQKALEFIKNKGENLEKYLANQDQLSEDDIFNFNYAKRVYFANLFKLASFGLIGEKDLSDLDKVKPY